MQSLTIKFLTQLIALVETEQELIRYEKTQNGFNLEVFAHAQSLGWLELNFSGFQFDWSVDIRLCPTNKVWILTTQHGCKFSSVESLLNSINRLMNLPDPAKFSENFHAEDNQPVKQSQDGWEALEALEEV